MNDKVLSRKERLELKQKREIDRNKQNKRNQSLKEKNIKRVAIEVSARDIDKLIEATGLVQKHALTKCVEIGVQALTQDSLLEDDPFSNIRKAHPVMSDNKPQSKPENHEHIQLANQLVNELHQEVQAAISEAEAKGKAWKNNRVLTSKQDIVNRLATTLNIDLTTETTNHESETIR
ncbi:hypothetical protein [Candidatus Albibeggiatoa sp. nov. BB20]|uniref:hypothetical protein n=1 Tax=Candidatus Albibeggiatoa sp. nov. BB20 TaxID=3162723 RepID=UPI0033654EAA